MSKHRRGCRLHKRWSNCSATPSLPDSSPGSSKPPTGRRVTGALLGLALWVLPFVLLAGSVFRSACP